MGTAEMHVAYSGNVKKGCTLSVIGSWFIL
jgi:hypothetical protein